jgi:hypothetical protein
MNSFPHFSIQPLQKFQHVVWQDAARQKTQIFLFEGTYSISSCATHLSDSFYLQSIQATRMVPAHLRKLQLAVTTIQKMCFLPFVKHCSWLLVMFTCFSFSWPAFHRDIGPRCTVYFDFSFPNPTRLRLGSCSLVIQYGIRSWYSYPTRIFHSYAVMQRRTAVSNYFWTWQVSKKRVLYLARGLVNLKLFKILRGSQGWVIKLSFPIFISIGSLTPRFAIMDLTLGSTYQGRDRLYPRYMPRLRHIALHSKNATVEV